MELKLKELETEVIELRVRVRALEERLTVTKPEEGLAPFKEEQYIRNLSHPNIQAGELKDANSATQATQATLPKMTITPERENSVKEKTSSQIGLSEDRLAGTWFNRLGIVAIVLAVGFFLKWSFDNHLIGEVGRIVIGSLIGLGFLGAGEFFQRRKFAIYGQGFSGGGIAILYFSIFSAFSFYHLISQAIAFALMVLITLAASLLSIRYDSRAIGILGIVSGFATPFVLSAGTSNLIVLLTYVTILDAGVLGVAFFKKWPVFNYLTFFFTYLTFAIGYAFDYHPQFQPIPFLYLTLFFLAYIGVSFARNVRLGEKATWADISLVLTNGAVYFALSYHLLARHFGAYMGYWAVVLGIVYLFLGQWAYKYHVKDLNLSFAFLGIAVGFISLAIPLQLKLFWIPVAWAIESVVILILSFRLNEFKVRVTGLLVLGLAILSLVEQPFRITGREAWIFLNNSALAYLTVIAAIAFLLYIFSRQTLASRDKSLFFGLQIVFNLLTILFFTLEISAYFNYRRHLALAYTSHELFQNAQAVALSLVWGIHAVILILLGFWRRLRGLRWFGLGFLSLVILKVFLYDLSNLSTPYRILSFVALGILLLGISWLYQRSKHLVMGGMQSDKSCD
ncbi:MAG: DUF2339 domain-containing protein [Desulfitobacteriaceae bacterium]